MGARPGPGCSQLPCSCCDGVGTVLGTWLPQTLQSQPWGQGCCSVSSDSWRFSPCSKAESRQVWRPRSTSMKDRQNLKGQSDRTSSLDSESSPDSRHSAQVRLQQCARGWHSCLLQGRGHGRAVGLGPIGLQERQWVARFAACGTLAHVGGEALEWDSGWPVGDQGIPVVFDPAWLCCLRCPGNLSMIS